MKLYSLLNIQDTILLYVFMQLQILKIQRIYIYIYLYRYSKDLNEYGLFASEDIKKETVVGLYTGVLCTDDESRLREEQDANTPKYIFMAENSKEKLNKELYYDGCICSIYL